MADTKKYLSFENLGYYDEKLKAWVNTKDEALDAKLQKNIDDANTAIGKEETRAKAQEATNAAAAEAAQAAADKAQGAADKAQEDVDSLKGYVGEFVTSDGVDTVVKYIDAKTANIASDETVNALDKRVSQAEKDIDAIEADYLKAADKTALEEKITAVQNESSMANTKVAEDLATEASERKSADNAQAARIVALEDTIKGLSGAMHFEGVKDELPSDVSGYEAGDVIIVGEKEYVFNGTEFKEFGDVSAEGERISTLETKMISAEGNITTLQEGLAAANTTLGEKADDSALKAEVKDRTDADSALDTRLKAVESAVGESGSVAEDIASAKDEAIATAAADATTKAAKTLSDAKAYTDTEVEKDRTRLDALEAESELHAKQDDLTALAGRMTTAEGEIDTLQSDVDAVEALAAANEAAIKALQTASGTHAKQADLDMEILRAKAAEEANANAIAAFKALTKTEIDGLFTA